MLWQETVTVKRKTVKAILVVYEDVEGWVPLSQIADGSDIYEASDVGETGVLVIPEWLAEEKGWML
jgi:hypothetical protein